MSTRGSNIILYRESLSPNIHLIKVTAPVISTKVQAGQFVIIRIGEKGERIPLTFADWDEKEGSITLIFMQVGTSTQKLALLQPGDPITNLVGPLGKPTDIDKFGTVLCVGGGIGIAPITPIARALKAAGNKVISIIGARGKELLFWEDRLQNISDELVVCTDDGSYGRGGLVTEVLHELCSSGQQIDRVFAIGPAIMMKFCAEATKPFGIKTITSLNSIMVDGTGMCGCCRVSVNWQTKFACVDGPEFDAHLVDWSELMSRQNTYIDEEKYSLQEWQNRQDKTA
ncbi:MAG: sulfide/dihydroorotate dehydrogenase-like FAD/NAD-binding protein [Dehalococcoidia bacterium]|nr:MAG: sulfide/dihydroorotate dehydrogenase-like FAD/NAD-binding protein [Dehalococcoidia bacterium]